MPWIYFTNQFLRASFSCSNTGCCVYKISSPKCLLLDLKVQSGKWTLCWSRSHFMDPPWLLVSRFPVSHIPPGCWDQLYWLWTSAWYCPRELCCPWRNFWQRISLSMFPKWNYTIWAFCHLTGWGLVFVKVLLAWWIVSLVGIWSQS